MLYAFAPFGLLCLIGVRRRFQRFSHLVLLVLTFLIVLGGINGCVANINKPPETDATMIDAQTESGLQHTAELMVTVD